MTGIILPDAPEAQRRARPPQRPAAAVAQLPPHIARRFHPNERVALFIDGANLYSAVRALNWDIDYQRLYDAFSGVGRLVRALYYTATTDDSSGEYSPLRPLLDWLGFNGYQLVTKPARVYTNSDGRPPKIKGNMDIELACDALELGFNGAIDHAVLFTGDGDFRALAETLQRRGIRISVVSTLRAQPGIVSDELRRQADTFIELAELAETIRRHHAAPSAS